MNHVKEDGEDKYYLNYQSHNDEHRLPLDCEESRLILEIEHDSSVNMSDCTISWEEGDNLIDQSFPDSHQSSSMVEDTFGTSTANKTEKPTALEMTSKDSGASELPNSRSGVSTVADIVELLKSVPSRRVRRRVSPDHAPHNGSVEDDSQGNRAGEPGPQPEAPCLDDVMKRLDITDDSASYSIPIDISHPSESSHETDGDQRKKSVPIALRKQAILRSALNGATRIGERDMSECQTEIERNAESTRATRLIELHQELETMRSELSEVDRKIEARLKKRKRDGKAVTSPGSPMVATEDPAETEDEARPKKRRRMEEIVMKVSDPEVDKLEERQVTFASASGIKHAINENDPLESGAHVLTGESTTASNLSDWYTESMGASPTISQPLLNEHNSYPSTFDQASKPTPTETTEAQYVPDSISSPPETQISSLNSTSITPNPIKPELASAKLEEEVSKNLLLTDTEVSFVANLQVMPPDKAFYNSKRVKELKEIATGRGMGSLFWAKKDKIIELLMEWDEKNPHTIETGGSQLPRNESNTSTSSPAKEKKSPAPWNDRRSGIFRMGTPFSSSPSGKPRPTSVEPDQAKVDTPPVSWEDNLSVEHFTAPTPSPNAPKQRKVSENVKVLKADVGSPDPDNSTALMPSKRRKLSENRATPRPDDPLTEQTVTRKLTRAAAAEEQIKDMKMTRANVAGLKADGPRKFAMSKRRSL